MIKPGIYRHYKGGMYKVHFEVKHSETLEDLVVYEALYKNPKIMHWVRPSKMFFELVKKDGKEVQRFQFVSE